MSSKLNNFVRLMNIDTHWLKTKICGLKQCSLLPDASSSGDFGWWTFTIFVSGDGFNFFYFEIKL